VDRFGSGKSTRGKFCETPEGDGRSEDSVKTSEGEVRKNAFYLKERRIEREEKKKKGSPLRRTIHLLNQNKDKN